MHIPRTDSELDLGGEGLYGLFHGKSFLTLLCAIGDIAVWGVMASSPSLGSTPDINLIPPF